MPPPDDIDALLDAIECALGRLDVDRARSLLADFAQSGPQATDQLLRYLDLLAASGQSLRALIGLQSAARDTDDVRLLTTLGYTLMRFERHEVAETVFARAAELDRSDPRLPETLASLRAARGDRAAAASAWRDLLDRWPEDPVALCGLWFMACEELDWSTAEALEPRLLSALLHGPRARLGRVPRYCLLGTPEHWPDTLFRDLPTHEVTGSLKTFAPRPVVPVAGRRIRLGYQSAHFREHATAILAVGLFEQHDRERFELFAFNLGAPCDDAYRQRCRAAFEHWIDCFGETDASIALRMRQANLDVLIDLDADNVGGRPGIAARHPAPVRIHYLGHPASTSVEGIDYFIADEITCPPGAEREFREQVIRLPVCYQPMDPKRARPEPWRKADAGLPEHGVAWCNFNQPWKWRRDVIEVWFEALRRAPSATLTLADPGPLGQQRLLEFASAVGVEQSRERVQFAPWLPQEQHLARLGSFDLALDQWPCNGHTTSADALWMGVPVLTLAGCRFRARVTQSLSGAWGTDVRMASTKRHYVALATASTRPARRPAVAEAERATPPGRSGQSAVDSLEEAVLRLKTADRVPA